MRLKNVDVDLTFHFMSKNGKLCLNLRFHNLKTRALIKDLRHFALNGFHVYMLTISTISNLQHTNMGILHLITLFLTLIQISVLSGA